MSNNQLLKQYLAAQGINFLDAKSLIPIAEKTLKSNGLRDALSIVNFATTLEPNNPEVLRGASGIIAESRNYQRCDELMSKAVLLEPNNAEYRLHYGIILLELKEYTKAKEELEIHFQLSPDSDLGWRNYSSVLACQGNYIDACKACEKALELNPYNREYAIHRVGLLIVLERVRDALEELGRLKDQQPDDPVVARLLSAAYEVAGDSDSALENAFRAYELAPEKLEYEQHLEHLQKVRGSIKLTGSAERTIDPRFPPTVKMGQSKVNQFFNAIKTSGRVITSLIIREARTRFGGTKLGYAWAIFEPVSHLVLLAVVFSFMHSSGGAPIGDSLLIYYFTGVLLYILFTNTIMHVQAGLESSRSLLQIPIVKPLDVLLARGLLELLTQVSVAVIMLTAFTIYGLDGIPNDIVKCTKAIVAVWCMGLGFGVINSIVSHFIKSWHHIFASVTRALYFTSGIFFSPLAMPPAIRDILAWNPMLQGIDLFRSGFFPYYEPSWLNPVYLYSWAVFILTISFGMERTLRRRVSSPT